MNRFRLAFRVAAFTAAAVYVLIAWGGVVHNTGSSLACPDWPLCNGEAFPAMTGGVFYEHGHRLLALLVGVCSLALAGLVWRGAPGWGSLRGTGLGLVALVGVQAALGAITVIYKLPTLVSSAHLAVSMLVLMTLVYLGWAARLRATGPDGVLSRATPAAGARTVLPILVVALAAVYSQIVLGALVRHTFSTDAAGIGPLAAIVPLDPNTNQYSPWPGYPPARLNVLHRYAALVVLVMVVMACARAWLVLRGRPGAWLAWLPVALTMLQIVVGVAMLALYPAIPTRTTTRTLHLAVGALVLAAMFLLTLVVARYARAPRPAAAAEPAPPGGQALDVA